jgi:hypothetical protein
MVPPSGGCTPASTFTSVAVLAHDGVDLARPQVEVDAV